MVEEGLFKETPTPRAHATAPGRGRAVRLLLRAYCWSARGTFLRCDLVRADGPGRDARSASSSWPVTCRGAPRRARRPSALARPSNAICRTWRSTPKWKRPPSIFGSYLPYAVAFGLEQSFIRKFQDVEAPPPPGGFPRATRGLYYGGGAGGGRVAGSGKVTGRGVPMEGGAPPSLEGMSKGLGTSLAGMSTGLGTMLSQASRTLTSTPAPSGGSGGAWRPRLLRWRLLRGRWIRRWRWRRRRQPVWLMWRNGGAP